MNSIIPNNVRGCCFICGRWGQTEEHHMIHGTGGRAKAERYGLKVQLCRLCHMELHDHGTHDRELQQIAQLEFEKHWGHRKWMEEFGKSYLGVTK